MHWIIRFLFKHKNLSSLILTVLLSLLMLSSPHDRQLQIARTLTLTVFYPFQVAVNQHKRIRNIFSENNRLRGEVASLNVRCALLENAAAENQRLKALLGFDSLFSYSLIPARTIAHEPTHLYRSVLIDAGKKKGISLYMPVISKDGVIGKVIQVTDLISLVHLFRDPSERLSVLLKNTRDVGIIETVNSRDFFIRFRKNVIAAAGDTVATSGLGGIYPPGLYVGVVSGVKDIENDPLFKMVFVKPFVDFERMEEVFVIKLSPQWESFRTELDSMDLSQ